MANSLVFVWIYNEECIRRVDVFFLLDPKDHLRLSFPTIVQPCQCKYFHDTLATIENGSYTRVLALWKGLRVVGCGLEIFINTLKPGRLN